jgi:ankyrin repeat protein
MKRRGSDVLIHDYARDGNVAGVVDELARNVDIEARDDRSDYTPLMYAIVSAEAGPDIVQFLLERGANPNAVQAANRHATQKNVLSLAVKAGNCDKIVLLLDAGADIRYESPKRYDVLIDAAYGANVFPDPQAAAIFRLLIDRGARLDTVTEYGESAVRVASENGRFAAVRVLLDAGSDAGPLKWTPLMRAVALGTLADVRAQLDRGADLAARDCWGRTSWLLSLQVGDVAKAQLLLAAGANPNDRGRGGKTPLIYPIANGHVDMLAWLLSKGLNPDATDDVKQTALMEAAGHGATECVKVLLEAGANIHFVNEYEDTAIALASNLDIVRLLVNRGADLNDISSDMRAALTKLPRYGKVDVSREQYLATKRRRFGQTNPEKMNYPFWRSMVAARVGAWAAKKHFDDAEQKREEIFCFERYGQSINELSDGRIIEIAGEYEDSYDPNFCIYNDVVVHHGDGTFDILGYPKEVFPPTDFHTATLVGQFIYIIGSLAYCHERRLGATPVYRLNIETLAIEKVQTSGDNPGWISQHKARLQGSDEIHIRGGKVCVQNADAKECVDNPSEYVVNLDTFVWHKVTGGG